MENVKIAIISAFIGDGGTSGDLTFTAEAKKELDDYGIDFYLYNDNNVDQLLPYFIPTIKRKDIVNENGWDKLKYRYYKYRIKQPVYPTEQNNHTRLVAKIARMLFFNFISQKYDFYIWLDSKFTIQEHWLKYILWLIDRFKGYDLLVSLHSERITIKQEMDFMVDNRNIIEWNLSQKYNMADMVYQYELYKKNKSFIDNNLYETTMLVYSKSILAKKEFLEEWYAHNFYFSIQDQISFPFLVKKYKIKLCGIKQRVFDMAFTQHEYGRH